jgi:hypothetical protein
MITQLLLSILKSKNFWIVLAIIAASIFVYNLWSENQQLKAEKMVITQNQAAMKDLLTAKADSVTMLAVFVEDLNKKTKDITDENRKLRNEIKLLKTQYQIVIDSIQILQHPTAEVVGDSMYIPILGKQSIVTYEGYAAGNIKTKNTDVNIKLSFQDINAASELIQDETDNIWRMRVFSLTPGIKVKGVTVVDEGTFLKMRGTNINNKKYNSIGIGGLIGSKLFAPGVEIRYNNWQFGAHYMLLNDFVKDLNWYDKTLISVHFFPF